MNTIFLNLSHAPNPHLANLLTTSPHIHTFTTHTTPGQIHNTQTSPQLIILHAPACTQTLLTDLAHLIQRHPQTKLLLLLPQLNNLCLISLLQTGIHGCGLTPLSPETLNNALETILHHQAHWLDQTIVTQHFSNPPASKPSPNFTAPADLTAKETEILQHLIAGKSYQAIANQLNIKERTIRYHTQNIYQKLNIQRREQLTQWLWQHLNNPTQR